MMKVYNTCGTKIGKSNAKALLMLDEGEHCPNFLMWCVASKSRCQSEIANKVFSTLFIIIGKNRDN